MNQPTTHEQRPFAWHKLGLALLVWLACDRPIANVELERSAEGVIPAVTESWQSLELHDFPVLTMRVTPPEGAEGQVGDVMLRRLYLEVVEPTELGFSFADSAVVYVEAEDVGREPVARIARIMPDSALVEFEPLQLDLTPYVEADEIILTVALDGRPPAEDVTLRAHVILDVGITTSAACEAITTGTAS